MKHIILFLIGGLIYFLLEILVRGHSYIPMIFISGLSFLLIGLINNKFDYNMPLWKQCGISCLIVTGIELISGSIFKYWLGILLWDYSKVFLNLDGIISVPYMILWYFLSFVAIVLDDFIRWKLFDEQKPHYTIF